MNDGYKQVHRDSIAYTKPKVLRRTDVTPEIYVETKAYPSVHGQPDAQLETWLISKNPRIRSEHMPHQPFRSDLAKDAHRNIVARIRVILQVEEPPCS